MAWKRPVSPPAVLMRLRLNKHLPLGGASTCHKPRRRRALEADTWGLERARAPGNKPRSRARQRTAPPGPGVHGQHCGGCTCPKQQEQACPGGPCSPTGPNATPGRSVFGRLDRRTQVLHEARNSPARKLSQGPLSRSIKSTDRLHRSRERAAGDRRGCLPPPRFLSVVTLQGPQVSASHWEVCTADCREELLYRLSLLGPFQTAQKNTAGGATRTQDSALGDENRSPIFNDSRQRA